MNWGRISNVCLFFTTIVTASDLRKIKLTVENLHLEKQKMEKEKNKKAGPKGKTKIKLRVEGDSVKVSMRSF